MDGVLSQEEINALLNEPGAEASDSAENELSDAQKRRDRRDCQYKYGNCGDNVVFAR